MISCNILSRLKIMIGTLKRSVISFLQCEIRTHHCSVPSLGNSGGPGAGDAQEGQEVGEETG